jgi:hypothetical protein
MNFQSRRPSGKMLQLALWSSGIQMALFSAVLFLGAHKPPRFPEKPQVNSAPTQANNPHAHALYYTQHKMTLLTIPPDLKAEILAARRKNRQLD